MPTAPPLGPNGGKAPKSTKKDGGRFLGIRLPTIPMPKFLGGNINLPDIGVHTNKTNPVAQVSNLVTGFPGGIARAGIGITKEGAELTKPGKAAVPVPLPGLSGLGLLNHFLTKGGRKEVKEKAPMTYQLLTSPVRTVRQAPDLGVGLVTNKGSLGERAANTDIGKQIHEEGILGTGLGKVADITSLAGGVGLLGKAAGLGKLAEAANAERIVAATSKAARLGEGESLLGKASEASAAGRSAEAMDLNKAAQLAEDAKALRAGVAEGSKAAQIGSKIVEGAQDVSRLGGHLMNAPAKPYEYLAKGLAKVPAAAATGVEKYVEAAGNRAEQGRFGAKIDTAAAGALEKGVKGVSDVVKFAGDKARLADLYYRHVTAPTQEALFRRLEKGESVESIRSGLASKLPRAAPLFNKLAEDLQPRVEAFAKARPKGPAERFGGQIAKAWTKSPEEWQAEVDKATAAHKAAKAELKALPDGDPKIKAAEKKVREAKQNILEQDSLRRLSMEDPTKYYDSRPVAEAMTPKQEPAAAPAEEAVPAPGTPGGASYEEVQKFNKENIKAVRAEFHHQVQESFAPGMTAGKIVPDMQLPKGSVDIGEAIKSRDYVAWDPQTGMEVKSAQITPETPVLPKQTFDEVQRYSKYNQFDKTNSSILKAYDFATGKWKHTVLALSPRWHFGNIVGNMAMAAAAGLSPADMVVYIGQARKMIKEGEAPAELLSSGFHFGEKALGAMEKGPLAGAERFKHPIQFSYQMNQYVDDLNRTMIYLAKKGEGVSSQAAVDMALKAAGDFGRMTPFEKNVLRRVLPFYAWQKHITKLAFRLPLEDPARVAWTLHLAEMGDQIYPDPGATPYNKDGTPNFNANSFAIGGKRINLNPANPFASSVLIGGGVENVTRSLNPMIGNLLTLATGHSLKRGFGNATTPELAAAGPLANQKPLLGGVGNTLQYLGQQVPQVRQAQDLVAGATKSRFDTGEERPTQYPEDQLTRGWQLLNMLGARVSPDLGGKQSKKVTTKKSKGGTSASKAPPLGPMKH